MAAEQQGKPQPKFSKQEKLRLGVLLSLGLLLMIGAGLWQNSATEPQAATVEPVEGQLEEQAADSLAVELEGILSQVQGAGQVAVRLTYQDHGSYQYMTEENRSEKQDGESSEATTAVTMAKSGGQGQPVLLNQATPSIQGVLVVAEGGADAKVQAALTKACANLLGVGEHRVTVLVKEPSQGGEAQ